MAEPSLERGDVLVVDDTPENLTLLAALLKGSGYRVRAVPSGALALKAAAAEVPDVVLLDVMMPYMDGYEVCRRLKEDERLRGVPVIFLSALSETLDKVKAFSSGGVDYVTKPFQIEEVEARVGTHVALRRAQVQLDARNRELHESYARLQNLETVRKKLTQMIVHDLKSPITAGTYFAAAVRNEAELPGELADAMEDIVTIFRVLNRMTLDMLDVAASEDGKLTPRLERVDVGQMLGEVVAELRGAARVAKKTLVVDVSAELGPVMADRELLRRVIENLLENAFKYVPDDGKIIVEAGLEEGGEYGIRIRDDGPGVPIEQREWIFEPNARLERDVALHTRSSRGLGLAFCRLAVEAHGGQISVEDNEPKGCTFVLKLPQQ